jgi:predicted regulator of amino acid metabolism with ACT domain
MHENAQMWSEIMRAFADSPSQERVARFLLENGLGVSAGGRVVCNRIAIPATQVAAAVGDDRRVVDATAKRILDDLGSRRFGRMRATRPLVVAGTWGSR